MSRRLSPPLPMEAWIPLRRDEECSRCGGRSAWARSRRDRCTRTSRDRKRRCALSDCLRTRRYDRLCIRCTDSRRSFVDRAHTRVERCIRCPQNTRRTRGSFAAYRTGGAAPSCCNPSCLCTVEECRCLAHHLAACMYRPRGRCLCLRRSCIARSELRPFVAPPPIRH
jgi:hypothetical protein